MKFAYKLLTDTSPRFEAIRQNTIVVLMPSINQRPDCCQFYPLPTVTSALAGTTNFVGNVPNSTKDNTNFIRVDHSFSDRDKLNGHYINYLGNVTTGGTLPTTGGDTNAPNQQNADLSETHTFSPTLLTELRLGFSRNKTQL